MTQRKSKDTNEAESGAQLPARSQFLLYTTENGQKRIEVRLDNETVWLTQIGMAELFQTTVANINIHLKNIYAEGELFEPVTIKEYLIVRQEGKRRVRRSVRHYNLSETWGRP